MAVNLPEYVVGRNRRNKGVMWKQEGVKYVRITEAPNGCPDDMTFLQVGKDLVNGFLEELVLPLPLTMDNLLSNTMSIQGNRAIDSMTEDNAELELRHKAKLPLNTGVTYIHHKNDNEYWIHLEYRYKQDGEWIDSVLYSDGKTNYGRSKIDFIRSFLPAHVFDGTFYFLETGDGHFLKETTVMGQKPTTTNLQHPDIYHFHSPENAEDFIKHYSIDSEYRIVKQQFI